VILYTVVLEDGTEHAGEYVGAQDGLMFLATAEEVIRIDQRKVAGVIVVDQP
jgi:hypothetical protein